MFLREGVQLLLLRSRDEHPMELGPGMLLCSCQAVCLVARALVLEQLAGVFFQFIVSPAHQDFYGNRDRADRREMTVGRRVVFCREGKKDGMSL